MERGDAARRDQGRDRNREVGGMCKGSRGRKSQPRNRCKARDLKPEKLDFGGGGKVKG